MGASDAASAAALRYNKNIEHVRAAEYPTLQDVIYVDHAGSTVYAQSLIQSYARDLQSNLYGNPHSDNTPSRVSGAHVDAIREQLLRFFGASPNEFDLVFTANATASIKLVGECLSHYTRPRRASPLSRRRGFKYVYHQDSHTSLVGLREIAAGGSMCLSRDAAVEHWINQRNGDCGRRTITLFAYPGQSNMTGRRMPRSWPRRIRQNCKNTYVLWDAAAIASTSPLDLSDAESAPDFTAVSLYKIFGYPDVGCLIVRKAAADILQQRRYFGGGTVDMVINSPSARIPRWHATKTESIHEALEDGTLNFHSIAAIPHAIETHCRLFGSLNDISSHCAFLIADLYQKLVSVRHSNNAPLCRIYTGSGQQSFGDPNLQGPTIALSVLNPSGNIHGYADVERHADREKIYLRSGSVCNPGGMAYLGWVRMEDMKAAWSAGHRCSDPIQEVYGQTTGIVRVSLGAMSTMADVDGFVEWLGRSYLDRDIGFLCSEKSGESECSLEMAKARARSVKQGNKLLDRLVKSICWMFCRCA
ncbi:putative secondary metabolism biosynthetic enzyme [Aspergillus puulaauensis]|uniref:Putative secondary metabolism biosynthetic enzyme n=1 Tax=Aspergillus puulaauensis TaxID=1220207 RepID=A0A7R7X9T5_9EURO|nr:putative secondary metabolism biosynthetic enzyme [Aspergillus puulaauensis]BCS17280.1 putative secondary metabolism biosynthetic enzyme [Aspergillus puulaauensis]